MSIKNIPVDAVGAVTFYIVNDENTMRDSLVVVRSSEDYHQNEPVNDGPSSLWMGSIDHSNKCMACFNKAECPGHFGMMKLKYPVIIPMFLKVEIVKWLKVLCEHCHMFRFSDEKVDAVIKSRDVKTVLQGLVDKQKKNKPKCERCGSLNHNYVKDNYDNVTVWKEFYEENSDELIYKRIMYVHEMEQIFKGFPYEELAKLGRNPNSHPKNFIIRRLRIPPNTVRPNVSKMNNDRKNKDDLTKVIKLIFNSNNKLPDKIPNELTDDYYEMTQQLSALVYSMHFATNDNNKGVKTNNNQALNSIVNRLKDKKGRIRGNLNGSRVFKIARSIITCDPSLTPDTIRLPLMIAKNITCEMKVREYNYDIAMVYYMNGEDRYPGCVGITKKSTGKYVTINKIRDQGYLEIGDIIHRHLVNGDVCNFSREPALEPSSLTCMKIKIMENGGNTIGLNVMSCPWFNADFDGDEMNAKFIEKTRSINEVSMLASPQERFISYKSGEPVIGQSQDNLAGVIELTRDDTKLRKRHAMQLFANTGIYHDFSQYGKDHIFTGYDIITILLQETRTYITYYNRPRMYNDSMERYRVYNENEINIVIENGVHKSGVLDKNAVGETKGTILHTIANMYGNDKALKISYLLQQIALTFLTHKGISIGACDAEMNEESQKAIHEINESLFAKSIEITEQLNSGNLIPPLGKSILEYYEELQVNTLDPGDDYWQHVYNSIDERHNYLFIYSDTGTKGSNFNFRQSSTFIGQKVVKGFRVKENFNKRSSIFFHRYDTDPRARGYIPESFVNGLSVQSFLSDSKVTRSNLIDRSLSTATAGEISRIVKKNLEGHMINYYRMIESPKKIIQFLYAGDAMDPRSMEICIYPPPIMSDEEIKEKYLDIKIDKKLDNKNIRQLIQEEYDAIMEDRKYVRHILLRREQVMGTVIDKKLMSPINPEMIIDSEQKDYDKYEIDIYAAHIMVKKFIESIPYVYMNEEYDRNKKPVPSIIVEVCRILQAILRHYLCISSILHYQLSYTMIENILTHIKMKLYKSMISYGKCIGIISAQSVTEPVTQLVIDSTHSSGAASDKQRGVDSIQELTKVAANEKMKSPSMMIYLMPEIEQDKDQVRMIANEIEMLNLKYFSESPEIFWEVFGKPQYPAYKHEKKMIEELLKYNPNIKPFDDLINNCIRIKLIKGRMIEKNLSIIDIVAKLKYLYKDIFIVHNDDNSEEVILRIYMRNILFNRGITQQRLNDFARKLLDTVIRGVDGINGAYIKSRQISYEESDGSIKKKSINYIFTNGANIEEILLHPAVDPSRLESQSLVDMYNAYGAEICRSKFVIEMYDQLEKDVLYRHFTVCVDEMFWTGYPTGLDRFGAAKRSNNALLQLSDADPVKVLRDSALYNRKDDLKGISSILIGKKPLIGSLYSTFKINEEKIMSMSSNIKEAIEDI